VVCKKLKNAYGYCFLIPTVIILILCCYTYFKNIQVVQIWIFLNLQSTAIKRKRRLLSVSLKHEKSMLVKNSLKYKFKYTASVTPVKGSKRRNNIFISFVHLPE
jgi:hypothetical protein